ncbi:conserved hypothetical protein [Thiomonas arsenitoxydans]|uniref:Uncharacterized protein n=1 Tax=Thiomonas arsenitoxydans (strain DSM 22701 / CIP 110005 / 3As) TaxID=426114 RepID=D6CVB8_THIA3|nr:hypothetical protein THI_2619 [Thiomonas arsenitoxydans]CQR35123.1 conserved hypothetical protein [Thiomonas arsenitoxydans]CQR37340.1 conserved hypothetical protein [Thiomonas arsenitoxydans]CQR37512.1 conserved hypothetical protein [Thiomonas arsenitoxydans]
MGYERWWAAFSLFLGLMPGAPKRDDVGAALVWAAVMRALHAKTPSRQAANRRRRAVCRALG